MLKKIKVNTQAMSLVLYDWLIDCFVFNIVSAIFQSFEMSDSGVRQQSNTVSTISINLKILINHYYNLLQMITNDYNLYLTCSIFSSNILKKSSWLFVTLENNNWPCINENKITRSWETRQAWAKISLHQHFNSRVHSL